ncbi:MAG: peptidoglycan-binding domain-containing protein [Candidatus Omnitrophica bacterium]|nr:peptidoglycan-binding domain-containing protein [Candidatus Omnitrophota bacterium]
MRNILVILLAVALGVSLMSCSKKEKTLEEMQQPMSPEDLNRLKTETQGQPAGEATVVSTTEQPVAEQLPPSGPFAPTAKDIQTALKNAGYYTGSIDGKIGPKSTAAIESFQKDNGLTVDGKVGPKTWTVLSRFLTASPVSSGSGD